MERYFDKNGKELKGRNKYQKTHAPVKIEETRCDGLVVDGECQKCGRFLSRNVKHVHKIIGALGRVEMYRDGSRIEVTK